ncbi:Fic family protein [Lactobacillus sp. LL6]|uniref:Fic family protein n=1 Tax=Lactobacillus sp. LL6 TaxID=2596827 RepID=UPI001F5BE095|nr:Fic family protein [Lactobacillus sp. LL6]
MINNEDKLSNLRKEIDKYRSLDKQQSDLLNQDIRIEHVWSSNAIEGSKLGRFEIEEIINRGVTSGGESIRDILAALDLAQAYDYTLDLANRDASLTQIIIRDINKIVLTKSNPEWGGIYREVEVHPAGVKFSPYAEPFDIEPKMNDLIDWSRTAKDTLHPVKYAADLHFKFVTIHPFRDGNGRTARLLMNFALAEKGYPVINIKPDKESRDDYLNILLDGQKNNDPSRFEELVANTVKKR